MKLMVEENCTIRSIREVESSLSYFETMLSNLANIYHLKSLEYFVITDSEHQNFAASAYKYARIIGTQIILTDDGNGQTAGKSMDGIGTDGEYRQAIVVKDMIVQKALQDVHHLFGTSLPEENTDSREAESSAVSYIGLPVILHEMGHAVDNAFQYGRTGIVNDQVQYDLSFEYEDYVEHIVLSLWGEYFAESFCYGIIEQDLNKRKENQMLACMKRQPQAGQLNAVIDYGYHILYFFVQRIACLHQLGSAFDYTHYEADQTLAGYVDFLRGTEQAMKKMMDAYLDWGAGSEILKEMIGVFQDFVDRWMR